MKLLPHVIRHKPHAIRDTTTNSYVRNYKTFYAKRTQFPDATMMVSTVITMYYEQKTMSYEIRNEPKRTQFQKGRNERM